MLDKYVILEKIGEGGQGEVFLAKILNPAFGLEKKVVIKFFPKNDQIRRYFVNEVKILSKMEHQNIISILDAGEIDQKYFLVLEYINGKNLKEFSKLLKDKRIETGEIFFVDVTYKIFQALKYAHTSKSGVILHSDVSPQNILIAEDGRIKLIDFGIAQMTSDPAVPKSMGKASYLPENVVNGSKAYDESTDLYSLGETLRRSIEDAGLEISEQVKYLVQSLKESDGKYVKINKIFTKTLKDSEITSLDLIERVFDRKVIIENTEISTEDFKKEKTKASNKKLKALFILIFTFFIILGFFLIKANSESAGNQFSILVKNKNSSDIIKPSFDLWKSRIESSEKLDPVACENTCYQAIFNLTIGHITEYKLALKNHSLPTNIHGLSDYFDKSYHYYKQTSLFLDNLSGKCDEVLMCQKASVIKKLLNMNVDITQSNKDALKDYIKYMSNEKESSDIVKNLNIIYQISQSEKSIKLNKALRLKFEGLSKYQLVDFPDPLTKENCRSIGDSLFLRQINGGMLNFDLTLNSNFAITISDFKDTIPFFDSNLTSYVLNEKKKGNFCSYKRTAGEIVYLKIWN